MLVLVPAGRVGRQFGLGEGAGRVLDGALIVGKGEVQILFSYLHTVILGLDPRIGR